MAVRLKHWDRKPRETEAAYAAFRKYLDAPDGRNVTRLAESMGVHRSLLTRWSYAWKWQDRSAAYDAYVESVAQSARDKVIASRAVEWEKRRQEQAETAYKLATKMQGRTLDMLAKPLEDGDWSFATATSMARTSVEIGFMACDVGLAEDESFDPMTATPEQCQRHLVEHAAKKALREASRD